MAKKKNNGKSFEKAIKESAEKQEIFFERFPDSNKFNQGGNNGIRFTLNSLATALCLTVIICIILNLNQQ